LLLYSIPLPSLISLLILHLYGCISFFHPLPFSILYFHKFHFLFAFRFMTVAPVSYIASCPFLLLFCRLSLFSSFLLSVIDFVPPRILSF
jgi:hypothetical protein